MPVAELHDAPVELDPRLEADLVELLAPERRPSPWSRIASFGAIPLAVALLAGLVAVPLLRPPTPTTIQMTLPAPRAVATAAPEPAPMPVPEPEPVPPAPALEAATTSQAEAEPEWLDRAGGFAAAFAMDYLGWSQLPEAAREGALVRYLAPGLDPSLGWIRSGPLAAATPIVREIRRDGDAAATVTVALRITGEETPRWVDLAIPVVRDEQDRIAVADLPTFVLPLAAALPEGTVRDVAELSSSAAAAVENAAAMQLALIADATGFAITSHRVTDSWRIDANTATARVEAILTDSVTDAALTHAVHIPLRRSAGAWVVEAGG